MPIHFIIIPISLFFFILSKFTKSPLLLVSLPIFFSLGEAGFINAFNFRFAIPFFYTMNFKDFSLLLLLISAIYAYIKWPRLFVLPKSILSYSFSILAISTAFYILMAWYSDSTISLGTIWQARYQAYIPFSTFLWLSIFRRSNISHLDILFNTLTLITLFGAILYSLSSIGLSIFPYTSWTSGQGFGTITRDFNSFPPYFMLALGYIFFSRRRYILNYSLFFYFILFIAVLLSYTRSWVFAFIISLTIPLVLSRGSKGRRILLLLVLPLVLFASFRFLTHYAPNNTDFLVERFSEFSSNPLPKNATSRLNGFSSVVQHLSSDDANSGSLITGAGWSRQNAQSYSNLELVAVMLGDSFWAPLLFRLGFLGIALWGGIFVISLTYSLRILLGSKYSKLPPFLKLSTVAVFWIIVRTTSSNEIARYPVIIGLLFSILIYSYVYPSLILDKQFPISNSIRENLRS